MGILNIPPSIIRGILKCRFKYWSTLFDIGNPANRKALWDDVRNRQAISNATACLKSLLSPEIEFTAQSVQDYFDELAQCDVLRESVEKYKDVIGKDFQARLSGVAVTANLFCYVAIRIMKPDIIIETGCAAGWTSALFLLVLHQNHKDDLFSIDLPPVAGQLSMDWTMPGNLQSGFLIPQELRSRWTLILGNAQSQLILLFEKIRQVDVFYHDSDHTYQHMMWEYASAWPYLSEQGLLISDDIGWNTAFWDFAIAMRRPIVVHSNNTNFGVISRP